MQSLKVPKTAGQQEHRSELARLAWKERLEWRYNFQSMAGRWCWRLASWPLRFTRQFQSYLDEDFALLEMESGTFRGDLDWMPPLRVPQWQWALPGGGGSSILGPLGELRIGF